MMNYRHEIVRLHQMENLSERHIAKQLDIPNSTVHYWLAKEDREEGFPPKRGRPRVTTGATDTAIFQQSQQNPFWSAVHLRDELVPGISVDTVRKRLKERGMQCRIPARKPALRPEHVDKRLNFARNHMGWSIGDWERVVFSDEKIFRASSGGPLRLYRPSASHRFEQRYIADSENPAGRFTICVWMAFGKNFRRMHRIEQRTLNSEYYTATILPLIEDHVRNHDLIFMHDNSSIHNSRASRHWCQTHNINLMEDWPPKGPDMNPVENVWGELVRRVRNNPENRNQLWENVWEAFQEMEDDYFQNLLNSMPRRIAKVIEAEGRWTKY